MPLSTPLNSAAVLPPPAPIGAADLLACGPGPVICSFAALALGDAGAVKTARRAIRSAISTPPHDTLFIGMVGANPGTPLAGGLRGRVSGGPADGVGGRAYKRHDPAVLAKHVEVQSRHSGLLLEHRGRRGQGAKREGLVPGNDTPESLAAAYPFHIFSTLQLSFGQQGLCCEHRVVCRDIRQCPPSSRRHTHGRRLPSRRDRAKASGQMAFNQASPVERLFCPL